MSDLCVMFVKTVQSLIKKLIKTDWTQLLPLLHLPISHLSRWHQERNPEATLPFSFLPSNIRLVTILPASSLILLAYVPHGTLQSSFNLSAPRLSERVLIYISDLLIPLLKILQWLLIICDQRPNSIPCHCQGQSYLGCWLLMQISGPQSRLLGLKSLESEL